LNHVVAKGGHRVPAIKQVLEQTLSALLKLGNKPLRRPDHLVYGIQYFRDPALFWKENAWNTEGAKEGCWDATLTSGAYHVRRSLRPQHGRLRPLGNKPGIGITLGAENMELGATEAIASR
jgi:hypothetical protein